MIDKVWNCNEARIQNKLKNVDEIANEIFRINYKNILNSEVEFCIGVYEKQGKLDTSKPIIGSDVEVEAPQVDGVLLDLVHTHSDGLDLSVWDEEVGREYANKNKRPFRIYVIGYNEAGDIVMTYEDFEADENT
jgi:hypothetical protein